MQTELPGDEEYGMREIAEPETGTGARQRSKGHAGNAGVRACQSSDIR